MHNTLVHLHIIILFIYHGFHFILIDIEIDIEDFSKSISGVGNDENGEGKHCVANEILAYMHRSAMSRTPEEIVSECAEKHKPEDIIGAKQYLLNEYGDKIKEYDEKIHGELGKKRIDSQGRKAIIANLHDIMTAFDILKEIQCDISALSDVRDPLVEYCETMIESRVAQLEMKFSCIDSLNG